MKNCKNNVADDAVSFGPFRLSASERLLVREDETVSVGGRALDILVSLIERAGEVVSKQELMERVWPNLIVEEANLRVHIANLRSVLGDGKGGNRYIVNVPGRGYSFIAPVKRPMAASVSIDNQSADFPVQKLPARLARMIGREDTIPALASLIRTHRFISIVGPGGMGKSTVAVEVAHTMLDYFYDGVFFVDLGALADASLVAGAIASATGCFARFHDPVASLLAFLSGKEMLLILDNCEHVIETVATLSERIFKDASQVHLLATSRETLRVEGENLYLLLPLGAPEADSELTAAKALESPAVQLLMERAAAAGYRRELDDTDAPFAAEICSRLDGIPLAIELVGSRAGVHGMRGLAKLLDNEFHLLWHGRRNAVPRHQTLQAMLSWSYNLLSESEQKILRRLSVFAGAFTPEAALWIAGNDDDEPEFIANALAGLVDKSLVSISPAGTTTLFYRLLDTTRRYVAARLAETGERNAVARQHARYYIHQLKQTETARGEDMWDCSAQLANVQVALDWSFSEAGDRVIGVQLAELAVPLFLRLSLLSECEHWCARALEELPEVNRGTTSELKLLEAFAISSMFSRGNSDEVGAAIQRGLNLAEMLNDRHHRLHLLAGLNIFYIRTGDFHTALTVAKQSTEVAKEIEDVSATIMVEWMLGVTHHLVGNQAAAQYYCERGFELAEKAGRVDVHFFGYDHRVRALVAMARALWLRGFPNRALKFARLAMDEAASRSHPVTVSISYIYSIPVFLWTGAFDEAAQHIEKLVEYTDRYSLEPYHAVALALKGELMIVSGEAPGGVELLRNALAAFHADRHHVLTNVFSRVMAEGLMLCGHLDEAVDVIDATIARSKVTEINFDFPDILRARGEILLSEPRADLVAAEKTLLRSISLARKQSAPGLELRASLPLAKIWIGQGHIEKARGLLDGIRRRFVEGRHTKDIRAASELLLELNVRHNSDQHPKSGCSKG